MILSKHTKEKSKFKSRANNHTFLSSRLIPNITNFEKSVPFFGDWVQIRTHKNDLCVKYDNKTNVPIQSSCGKTDEFLWRVEKTKNFSSYNIFSKSLKKFVFEIKNDSLLNRTAEKSNHLNSLKNDISKLMINSTDFSIKNMLILAKHRKKIETQLWTIEKFNFKNRFFIKNLKLNKCLDNTGIPAENRGLQIWQCSNNNLNQAFYFFKPILFRHVDKLVNIETKAKSLCLKGIGKKRQIQMGKCGSSKDFQWKFMNNFKKDGTFFIGNAKIELLLDIYKWKRHNGNNIVLNKATTAKTQAWDLVYSNFDDYFMIKNKFSGKCLSSQGKEAENKTIIMWECDANNENLAFKIPIARKKTADDKKKINEKKNNKTKKNSTAPAKPITNWIFIKSKMDENLCLKNPGKSEMPIQAHCQGTLEFSWRIMEIPNTKNKILVSKVDEANKGKSNTEAKLEALMSKNDSMNKTKIIAIEKKGANIELLNSSELGVKLIKLKDINKCLDNKGKFVNGLKYELNDCLINNKNQQFIFKDFKLKENTILFDMMKNSSIVIENYKKLPSNVKPLKLKNN